MPTPLLRSSLTIVLMLTGMLMLSDAMGQEIPSKPVTVEIEKKDATMLKGRLLGIARDSVRIIDDNNQEWKIALKEIRNIEYIDTLRKRERWFDSPNTMRYLLTSTALPLRKKEVVLQATYLVLVSVHYGLTNRVSIGAGTDIFTRSTYFLNTKINLVNEGKYKFSTGINYYRLPRNFITTSSHNDIRDLGMLYGTGTWGDQNHHLSIGAGYMYAGGSFLPPIVTVSGTTRFAKHFALVTENWFFFVGSHADLPVLISLGARYISKRSSVDLAFYNDQNFSLDTGFPYIGYTFKIGKN